MSCRRCQSPLSLFEPCPCLLTSPAVRRSRVVAPFSPPAALSLFGRLCTGARSTLACAREGSKADSLRSSHAVAARRPNPLVRLDCSAGRVSILTRRRHLCRQGGALACRSERVATPHRPHQSNGPPLFRLSATALSLPSDSCATIRPDRVNAAPTRQNRRHAPSPTQDSPRHLRPRHPLCAYRVRLDASLLYALLPSQRSS